MKLVLEEKDLLYINRINEDLRSGKNPCLFCSQERHYSISFDVTDIAKANAFIVGIVMDPERSHAKEIEDLIGIRFTSLNYTENQKIGKLKYLLEHFLNELDTI